MTFSDARNSWAGTDDDPVMDWRAARDFTDLTRDDEHEVMCPYRDGSRAICGCNLIAAEYDRRVSEHFQAPAGLGG